MNVIKKDGSVEAFEFCKITRMVEGAVQRITDGHLLQEKIEANFSLLVRDGISSTEIQEQLINTAKNLIDIDTTDMSLVAGRLLMSDIISSAEKARGFEFGEVVKLYKYNLEGGLYEDKIDLPEYYKILTHLEGHLDRGDNYTYGYASVASWKLRYLHRHETPVEVFAIIAARIALHSKSKFKNKLKEAEQYLKVLSRQQISLATPFLLNLRMKDGNLSSCFVMNLPDDLGKQYDALKAMAMISKNGGGIGAYIGNVRAKGSRIGMEEGLADSVIPFIRNINDTAIYVNQSGKRVGAITVALPAWHADILEYLNLQTEIGESRRKAHDIFLQVVVDRAFIEGMEHNLSVPIVCPLETKEKLGIDLNADPTAYYTNQSILINAINDGTLKVGSIVRARDIFKLMIGAQVVKGTPYVFFTDNVNEVNPLKDVAPISSTNLCVSGDTKILTKRFGYIEIEKVSGQTLECWNGREWSNTPIFRTDSGDGQKVLTVELSNGQTIRATEYHRWMIQKGYNRRTTLSNPESTIIKETKDLKIGDNLVKHDLPIANTKGIKLDLAYENGFFSADGTSYLDKNEISLYHGKQDLLNKFFGHRNTYNDPKPNRTTLTYSSSALKSKFFVPSYEYSLDSKLNWFAGYLDGDGYISKVPHSNGISETIQAVSTNKEFLQDIMFMLQEIGVNSKISPERAEGYRELPANDGTGSMKQFLCKETHRLLISTAGTQKLLNMGMTLNRLSIKKASPQRDATRFVTIVNIIDTNDIVPTYCGTEPKLNMLMFNGVLTMNCVESTSAFNDDMTHTCNLVSLVLPNINLETELKEVTSVAVQMLDAIVDISTSPDAKAQVHNDSVRVLGIGSMGLHDVLAINKKTYENDVDFIEDIFERISLYSLEASIMLAKEFGKFPLYDKSEWAKGLLYSRPIEWYATNSTGYFEEWVRLEALQNEHGMRNLQLQAIAPNTSTSVLQGVTSSVLPTYSKFHSDSSALGALPIFPKYIKEAFWHYKDYQHHDIIDMNTVISKIQKWTDSGISYEWSIRLDDVSITDIANYYIDAYKKKIKTVYYVRYIRSSGDSNEKEECVSCSG